LRVLVASGMKFSFINPGPNETLLEGEKTMIDASPPLGILYLASVLKAAEVEVSALDNAANGFTLEEAADWAVKEEPDILGLSVLASSSLTGPRIAHEVKKRNPDIIVILGNHHATFNAERILKKYPDVDMIVRGEGEQTVLEVVDRVEQEKDLRNVLGVTYRDKDGIVTTSDRPLTKDIDSLPFPHRSLVGAEYHNTTFGINVAPKKFTSFIASRGCAFKCRFCNCGSIARNRWRPRSVDNIMDELHLLSSEGYEQIMFVDDNFTMNQKRIVKLCQRMRKERIDMEWMCEGRVDHASYTMFREMVRAGLRLMYFGIESGTQKVLDYYDKRITPRQSEKAVANARKAGVDLVVGSFIIGAPHETKHDVQITLNFARGLDLDIPQINVLGVFPGSSIWEEFRQKGLLDEDEYWERGVCLSNIYPDTVPLTEMRNMIRDFYHALLRSPRFLAREIRLTAQSSYRRNIFLNNLSRVGIIKETMNRHSSM
jgi:anaerobic magnesium-protoporphyrin IX monomethyl ester cyclase